jgi:hypothetical protein
MLFMVGSCGEGIIISNKIEYNLGRDTANTRTIFGI